FLYSGWGFDVLYDRLAVRPFAGFALANAADFIDRIYAALVGINLWFARLLRRSQNGKLRWYAFAAGAGALVAIYLVVYA
ncbi:hypothetical protein NPN14_24020, partial [Vibrio parahaemolyticus]|uniref:hypothetical protein n=1 Tax=Vibrio parahaemolyticus TaxID=670 RepID=UPI00273A69DA